MKLLRFPFHAFVYFSVATILAEATLLSVLWCKGKLHKDTAVQLIAVSQDVDLQAMWRELELKSRPVEAGQVSYDEVLVARKLASLDLDLQEIAADKGLISIRELETQLETERIDYEALKRSYDLKIEQLRQGAVDEALQEVQRQLESLDAKLAKDQLLRIMEDPNFEKRTTMEFVVTMFKGMPLDKRKRIVAQFKSENEIRYLHEILRQIRLGQPDVDIIRQTRNQLQIFESGN